MTSITLKAKKVKPISGQSVGSEYLFKAHGFEKPEWATNRAVMRVRANNVGQGLAPCRGCSASHKGLPYTRAQRATNPRGCAVSRASAGSK
jgi:hypothetical protein